MHIHIQSNLNTYTIWRWCRYEIWMLWKTHSTFLAGQPSPTKDFWGLYITMQYVRSNWHGHGLSIHFPWGYIFYARFKASIVREIWYSRLARSSRVARYLKRMCYAHVFTAQYDVFYMEMPKLWDAWQRVKNKVCLCITGCWQAFALSRGVCSAIMSKAVIARTHGLCKSLSLESRRNIASIRLRRSLCKLHSSHCTHHTDSEKIAYTILDWAF